MVEVLVKTSVTREDGGEKGGWRKERGRQGGRVTKRITDKFQGRESEVLKLSTTDLYLLGVF